MFIIFIIFEYLPGKYDKRWLIVLLILTLAVLGIFYVSTRFVLGAQVFPYQVTGMVLISLTISFLICLFGFLNARILFISASIALLAAFFMLISIFSDKGKNGWEDIIGILTFGGVLVIGIAAGIAGELVAFVLRKLRKGKL